MFLLIIKKEREPAEADSLFVVGHGSNLSDPMRCLQILFLVLALFFELLHQLLLDVGWDEFVRSEFHDEAGASTCDGTQCG